MDPWRHVNQMFLAKGKKKKISRKRRQNLSDKFKRYYIIFLFIFIFIEMQNAVNRLSDQFNKSDSSPSNRGVKNSTAKSLNVKTICEDE